LFLVIGQLYDSTMRYLVKVAVKLYCRLELAPTMYPRTKSSKLQLPRSSEAPRTSHELIATLMRPFGTCSLPLLWIVLLESPCFPLLASDQPQWGQAWSRNMVAGERGLPQSFDLKTGQNIKWSAELGTEAHSTPIVAGGRVYIGTNNGHPRDPQQQGDRGVLMCFDEQTGQFLWQLLVPKREEDIYFDWPQSGISSPVTVESNRVYLVSNRGEVLCLDVGRPRRPPPPPRPPFFGVSI